MSSELATILAGSLAIAGGLHQEAAAKGDFQACARISSVIHRIREGSIYGLGDFMDPALRVAEGYQSPLSAAAAAIAGIGGGTLEDLRDGHAVQRKRRARVDSALTAIRDATGIHDVPPPAWLRSAAPEATASAAWADRIIAAVRSMPESSLAEQALIELILQSDGTTN